jgi:hypothetical protein
VLQGTSHVGMRVNVGPGTCSKSCLSTLSRIEHHRQHHPASTVGHVCAFICESRTLDRDHTKRSSRVHLPCCSHHCINTIPAASPTALLILQVVDTAQQQDEACRGRGVKSQDKDARTKDKVTEVPLARSTTHVSPVPSTTHRHEDGMTVPIRPLSPIY